MIGAIIGDIVGSRFEFNNIRTKDFELFTDECRFTDDTVAIIAIADAILNDKPYRDCLVKWGKKYPKSGFSSRFLQWIENPEPYNSFGNGALMRISPFGYARLKNFSDFDLEINKAVSCSHDTDIARDYASCLVKGILCALRGDKEGIIREAELLNIDTSTLVEYYQINNKFDATCQGTLPVAIACFIESTSFEDAIRNAVSVGGDSNTITSITGALAGAYWGVPQSITNMLKKYLPEEMCDLIDKFVIKFDSIRVPFLIESQLKDLPEDFIFIKTKTIFN
ncbi:MAG: ADP-ribosylglycohydrolase family protein [bacterium]